MCVIGLGKIGLPLACAIGSAPEYKVIGLDLQEQVVEQINDGISTVYGEPGLDDLVSRLTKEGRLIASSSYEKAISSAEIVVIATPLYTNEANRPDFKMLDDVVEAIGPNLSRGTLIILETTVPIGTTRERIWSKLLSSTGFSESDIFIAFSPERVSTGSFFKDLSNYPKVVGGVNDESAEKAADFYKSFINFSQEAKDSFGDKVVFVTESAESAEFVKLAETSYRDLNIALANQFQSHAKTLGLSFSEIRAASNSQPYSHIHLPGIWVGGHCIPVYPHFYLWTDGEAEILRVGRQINSSGPVRVADYLSRHFGSRKDVVIAIFGVSYRPGVRESAFSGAFAIRDELTKNGFEIILATDALFTNSELSSFGLQALEDFSSIEVLILQTNHKEYSVLNKNMFPKLKLVIDGRGLLRSEDFEGITFMQTVT